MFYEIKYTNELNQIVEFKADKQGNIFVSPVEPSQKLDKNPYKLMRFEGMGEVEAFFQLHKSPNQDGRTHTGTTLGERYLFLQFITVGKNWEDLSRLRRHITKVFNPRIPGKLELSYGTRKYAISVLPEHLPNYLSEDIVGKTQVVSVNLVAPNPYWKNVQEIKQDIALWRGSFEFPLEIIENNFEMGYREPSLIVNVINRGDVPCGMTIEFRALATLENPSIYHVGSTEFFKVNRIMQAGDLITVTTHFQNKRVELTRAGIKQNIFNWIDGDSQFIQLYVGDNLLRYDADEGLDNLEVSIYYNPQYLGV